MIEAKEKEAIEQLVAAMVNKAVSKAIEEKVIAETVVKALARAPSSEEEAPLAERNEKKRLDLFEQVIRLEEGQKQLKEGQNAIIQEMNNRFEGLLKIIEIDRTNTNQRFEEMRLHSDQRFEEMQQQIDRRFKTIVWILGAMITIGGGFALFISNTLVRILQLL